MKLFQPSLAFPAKLHARLPIVGPFHGCSKLASKCSWISNSRKSDCSASVFLPANESVAAIVFGDGSESRLYPLTKRRASGAIPVAGNYRLIDVVVSNCINSNITKIYALTQFNSTSLNSHLSRAYSGVGLGKEGFVEVIAAYQSPEDQGWFQGTADAVRRCLWVLDEYPVREFLVLPGHHLYKMDYLKLIEAHRMSNADITIASLGALRYEEDPDFGILQVNSHDQVVGFKQKLDELPIDRANNEGSSRASKNVGGGNFSSMGIYVINRDIMIKLLREYFPNTNELGSEIISGAISRGMKVKAYFFDGYWDDMRSIPAFYQANLESTRRVNKGFNFNDRDSPVYTLPRHLPPTLATDAVITDSVIGDGCILKNCMIKSTVVGMRTKVGNGVIIEDSVIMGADIYETEDISSITSLGGKEIGVPVGIGDGSHIRKAILDKNVRIGKNVKILNKDMVQEANMETSGYIINGGITVILKNAVIPDGTIF